MAIAKVLIYAIPFHGKMKMTLYRLFRPLLFMLGPETSHSLVISALKSGLVPKKQLLNDSTLEVNLWGITFPNPIGLAAGFDKNAEVPDKLLKLGFGFVEVGTITPNPQQGCPKPRVFRLMKDRAIINRMGFNSQGQAAALNHLTPKIKRNRIIGVNIGANWDTKDYAADYVKGIRAFSDVASYIAINVSSPNTPGLRSLQSRDKLTDLLKRLSDVRHELSLAKPLLLKIAPDLNDDELASIAETSRTYAVDGIIISNTTVSRPFIRSRHASEIGGLSGAPLFELSTRKLARLYRLTGGKLPLVGVGGVSSAETAWQKFRAGASLVQFCSAFVYEGPYIATTIGTGLSKRLRSSGRKSITDIIGTGISDWL